MTARKNSLQAVLERQAKADTPDPVPATIHAAPAPVARTDSSEPVRESDKTAKFHRPSREGRKLIAGHFDPKVAKQLKLIAAEDDTTVQALLEEALNLLFVKKGRGVVARD